MDEKKNYICKILKDNNNNEINTEIFNIINLHKYKFTENINGIFINLDIINGEVITEIYNLIKNSSILNESKIDDKEDHYKIDENEVEGKETKKKKVIKDIYLKDFKNSEKEIIKYSKQYIL